jgi:hypothetical protein
MGAQAGVLSRSLSSALPSLREAAAYQRESLSMMSERQTDP